VAAASTPSQADSRRLAFLHITAALICLNFLPTEAGLLNAV
jgi:hypothetical protein